MAETSVWRDVALASLSNVVKYLSVCVGGGDASHPYSASSRRRRRRSVQCADDARVQHSRCSRADKIDNVGT
jgi:hypothetical protein